MAPASRALGGRGRTLVQRTGTPGFGRRNEGHVGNACCERRKDHVKDGHHAQGNSQLRKRSTGSGFDDTTVLEQYGVMVERMAKRLISRTGLRSAYDDLWSAGAIGLIEAGRRFDSTRGASFATLRAPRARCHVG